MSAVGVLASAAAEFAFSLIRAAVKFSRKHPKGYDVTGWNRAHFVIPGPPDFPADQCFYCHAHGTALLRPCPGPVAL